MVKVEVKQKFNMSVGTVLVIKATDILTIGDEIIANDEKYVIKGFLHPSGSIDLDLISVIV